LYDDETHGTGRKADEDTLREEITIETEGSDETEPEDDFDDEDIVEGVDEDGNKVLLRIVKYFFYNGEEYVVLGDAQDLDDLDEDECECGEQECECCECEECHEHDEACECDDEECTCDECDECEDDDEPPVSLYIMKVVPSTENGEDMEEFLPVEDEALLDKLIEIVTTDFDDEDELDEDDEPSEDDEK